MLVDHVEELSEVLFVTHGSYDVIGCVNHKVCLGAEQSTESEQICFADRNYSITLYAKKSYQAIIIGAYEVINDI